MYRIRYTIQLALGEFSVRDVNTALSTDAIAPAFEDDIALAGVKLPYSMHRGQEGWKQSVDLFLIAA